MKWKYPLGDESIREEEEKLPPQIFITGNNSSSGSVKILENTIFYYADVTEQSALDLNAALYEVDAKLKNTANFLGPDFKPHIKLRINSYGGSLFAGLAVVDTIRNLYSDVHTYIDGAAASAATIMSVCGKKRYIGKHSFMLIQLAALLLSSMILELNSLLLTRARKKFQTS
jgi:ATP-dependent protease ClpP protease subunit